MKTYFVGIKGVIMRDGKVLLLHTNPRNENRGDRWEMPGGKMDANETTHEALERELQEELLNIKIVQIGDIVGAHRVHKDIEGDTSLVLIYYYVEAEFDGEPQLSDEHLEYKWADADTVKLLAEEVTQPTILKAFQ